MSAFLSVNVPVPFSDALLCEWFGYQQPCDFPKRLWAATSLENGLSFLIFVISTSCGTKCERAEGLAPNDAL
jgi:hypothetical protein